MVQLQSSERRRSPRARYTTDVEYQCSAGLDVARLVDVSGVGLLMEGLAAPAVGGDVWLKFKPPSSHRPIFLQGRVVRVGGADEAEGGKRAIGVGFVDPAGQVISELDQMVRRFLGVEALVEDVAAPRVDEAPTVDIADEVAAEVVEQQPAAPVARVVFANEREFLEAYAAGLSAGALAVVLAAAHAPGTLLETEIDLPNYYEPIRFTVKVVGEAESVGARGEWRHATQAVDLDCAGLRFIHDFASVFLGARHPKPAAQPPTAGAAAAEPAAPPAPLSMSPDDLRARAAEALAEFLGLPTSETPAAAVASERAADQETKRIERMADLVAETLGLGSSETETDRGPRVGGKGARAWLTELADDDPDRRAAAAQALGKLGTATPEAVEALCGALADGDPRVRRSAAWAIGDLGRAASEAVPALMTALEDEDARVRWRVVRALRAIGPAATLAVPDLSKALTDEDDRVRQWATTALEELASIGGEASLSSSSV